MSTSYYGLKEGITSLRLEEGPGHDRLTVFEHGANTGTLVLSKGMGKRVALMFAEECVDDLQCPMRSHWGGPDVGSVITENRTDLDPSTVLVSEYGEVLSVQQIRSRHGTKRSDGMPTELFGYERKP